MYYDVLWGSSYINAPMISCVCVCVKDHGECLVKIYQARANVKPCSSASACCLVHLVREKTHAAFQLSHLSADTDGKHTLRVGKFISISAVSFVGFYFSGGETNKQKKQKPAYSFIFILLNYQNCGFHGQNILAVFCFYSGLSQ